MWKCGELKLVFTHPLLQEKKNKKKKPRGCIQLLVLRIRAIFLLSHTYLGKRRAGRIGRRNGGVYHRRVFSDTLFLRNTTCRGCRRCGCQSTNDSTQDAYVHGTVVSFSHVGKVCRTLTSVWVRYRFDLLDPRVQFRKNVETDMRVYEFELLRS